jgi:hypothetical protein
MIGHFAFIPEVIIHPSIDQTSAPLFRERACKRRSAKECELESFSAAFAAMRWNFTQQIA